MLSPLRSWISPRDPRGITVWGTLATLGFGVLLWNVNGTLSEVWPNRCSPFQTQLSSLIDQGEGLDVIAREAPQKEERASFYRALNLWEISTSQTSWIIPRAHYTQARVRAHLSSTFLLELTTRDRGQVTAYRMPDRDLSLLYTHLVGRALNGLSDGHRSQIRSQFTESTLRQRALSLDTRAITCEPDRAEVEVVDLAALMIKDELLGLKDAWRLNASSWLTEHHLHHRDSHRELTQIQRRLYRISERSDSASKVLWSFTWRLNSKPQQTEAQTSTRLTPPHWLQQLLQELDVLTPEKLKFLTQRSQEEVIMINAQQSLFKQ